MRNLFKRLGLAVLQKTFNGWLPLIVFAGWRCPMCVTGTWVPPGALYCNLYVGNNFQLMIV